MDKDNTVKKEDIDRKVEIGDTITWKGVNRIEKGVVEKIFYNNGMAVSYLTKTARGYVAVAPSSVRSAFFAGTSNRTSDEQ